MLQLGIAFAATASSPANTPVETMSLAASAGFATVYSIEALYSSFHLAAYNEQAVNYNRDLQVFPVVRNILHKITGDDKIYQSPTDMGVNMVGFAISDDNVVRKASNDEIIRRYYKSMCELKKGTTSEKTVERIKFLMGEWKIDPTLRKVAIAANQKQAQTKSPVTAIELASGKIITGRTKDLMTSACACILNALKHLAHIDDNINLIPKNLLEPVLELKRSTLGMKKGKLTLKDVLMLLSINSVTNPTAEHVLKQLNKLKGLEAHSSSILNTSDQSTLVSLGIHLTSEPYYSSKSLYNQE